MHCCSLDSDILGWVQKYDRYNKSIFLFGSTKYALEILRKSQTIIVVSWKIWKKDIINLMLHTLLQTWCRHAQIDSDIFRCNKSIVLIWFARVWALDTDKNHKISCCHENIKTYQNIKFSQTITKHRESYFDWIRTCHRFFLESYRVWSSTEFTHWNYSFRCSVILYGFLPAETRLTVRRRAPVHCYQAA